MSEYHKLTATFLNNIGVGFIIFGMLRPILETGVPSLLTLLFMLFWVLIGIGIHLVAREYLRRKAENGE